MLGARLYCQQRTYKVSVAVPSQSAYAVYLSVRRPPHLYKGVIGVEDTRLLVGCLQGIQGEL
jgi:hypothetical protein